MKEPVMNSLRKWLLKPKRSDQSLLAKFYYADEELNAVASELDSFDGRKDTARCNSLVTKLRSHQDSVLVIIEQIMREIIPGSRARRDYRLKFPEEVLQENLAGQLWFGAECLAAGSSIVNKEIESLTMRPLAKSFTKQLDELRSLLRDQCFRNLYAYTAQIREALVNFDQLFADFELSYVSIMVPVKSMRDYDALQDVTVLFCETASRAMASGLLNQEQFDSYDPLLMFAIPRLAIVCGLLVYPGGPLNPDQDPCQVSEMFRQQLTLLFKIRELLITLDNVELKSLERLICNPDGSQGLSRCLLEGDPTLCSPEGEAGEESVGDADQSIQDSDNCGDQEMEEMETVTLSENAGQRGGIEPCPARPLAWRGSEEFIFRLPRNTSGKNAPQDRERTGNLPQGGTGLSSGYDPVQDRKSFQKGENGNCGGTSSSSSSSSSQRRKPRRPVRNCRLHRTIEPQSVVPDGQQKTVGGSSSSSCDSAYYLELEQDSISRIIQMARESAGMEARSKFKNSSDLVHQLFVCISKVADQLQTNFASDFRHILKATFECQSSIAPCIVLGAPDDDLGEDTGSPPFPPPRVGAVRSEGGNNEVDLTAIDALEELVNAGSSACQEPFLAPVWLPDETSQNCMSCKVHFTFVRRRHHCRNCGKIFCSQCSSNYVALPHIGHSRPVRACNSCYIFHIIPFTNAS